MPYDCTHIWNLRSRTDEQGVKERQTRKKTLSYIEGTDDHSSQVSRGCITWGMGIKETTFDEHGVLYVSDESLGSAPETNIEWLTVIYIKNWKKRLTIPFTLTVSKMKYLGQPRWLSSLALTSAQGLILETQHRVPHQAPCMEPDSPSTCVSASLSLSLSFSE